MADIEEIIKYLLSNKKEEKVLESLYQGRKSFTELKEAAGIKHNAELSRALKNLGRFVLFDHVYKRSEENNAFSYYEINPLGKEAFRMVKEVENYIARLKAKPRFSADIIPQLSFQLKEAAYVQWKKREVYRRTRM